MQKRKYSSAIMILILLNFVGMLLNIDLTPTYLFLAFMMLVISFISFMVLWKRLNTLVDNDADEELIVSTHATLVRNPMSMVSAILPYILVICLNLTLKSFGM